MGKKNSYFLGILLTIIIGTVIYYLTCCKTCSVSNRETQKIVDTPKYKKPVKEENTIINPFTLSDTNGTLNITINDNFKFSPSNYSFIKPLSNKLNSGIDTLSNYLKANPNKTINITGLYKKDEVNNSAFPNLGIARATTIKNHLISMGISSKNTNTYGKLVTTLKSNTDNIFVGPIEYSLTTTSENATKEDFSTLKTELNSNPLIFHFKTGESHINLNKEQRNKIAKIARYLDKVNKATIHVVGHTDNKGKRPINIELGQGRADFAKNYLIENGIPSSKIKTSSKGPDMPMTTNETPQGRAKNRRTTVTIN